MTPAGLEPATSGLGILCNVVRTHTFLGCLENAYEERHGLLMNVKVWPAFKGLRSDPRYEALSEQMGLP